MRRIVAGSSPTRRLVPFSMVIGRSVLRRIVRQGTRKKRTFLLNSAGIRQHHARFAHQAQKFEVAQGRRREFRSPARNPHGLHAAAAYADERGTPPATSATISASTSSRAAEFRRVIYIRRPVQRHDRIRAGL